jgi:hypothetical protein
VEHQSRGRPAYFKEGRMIVTPYPLTLTLPEPDTPRTQGVHISKLISMIATEMGILKPEYADDLDMLSIKEITDQVSILRMSIGLAWEEWYFSNVLSKLGVIHHPGEMVIDDIYGTDDGQSLDVTVTQKLGFKTVVHECKATYKSLNTVKNLDSQWMWLSQIKAYCKGRDTLHAMLHVLFLCGDYVFPITPQLRVWQLEFTQQEIDENWKLIRDYRDSKEKK